MWLDSLWVALGGMAIVLVALALVMLTMMALNRLFKPETRDKAE